MFEKIRQFVDHNRFLVIGAVLSLIPGCWLLKTPTVESPINPGTFVNSDQLTAEERGVIAKFEAARKTLDDKIAFRREALDLIGSTVQSLPISVPYASVIGGVLGLLGLGAVSDNIRKNSVLNEYKTKAATLQAAITNLTEGSVPGASTEETNHVD